MLLDKNYFHFIACLIILFFLGCNGTINTDRDLQVKDKLSQITANKPTSHIELLLYEKFNQNVRNSYKNSNYRL